MPVEHGGYRPPVERGAEQKTDRLDNSVEFARQRMKDGYLSSGEVNTIVAAKRALDRGDATDRDTALLDSVANKSESVEQAHSLDVKVREAMRRELGDELLERAESASHGIDYAIKRHLLRSKGPTVSGPDDVAELWVRVSNAIQGRLGEGPETDAERLRSALEGFEAALRKG